MILAVTVKQALMLAGKARLKINDPLIAQQATEAKATALTDDVKDSMSVSKMRAQHFTR